MSNIREALNLLPELSRDDLELLLNEATRLFRSMRKVRIKRIYKRCGKPGCTCEKGELTDYGHGPYLYVIWSENGKRRQKSVGRVYYPRELAKMAEAPFPVWFEERFLVSEKKYDSLTASRRFSCKGWALTDAEFLEYYGLHPDEDSLGRPRRLRYDKEKFDAEKSKVDGLHTIGWNEFRSYGIGTLRGVLLLRSMLAKGFYLASSAKGDFDD